MTSANALIDEAVDPPRLDLDRLLKLRLVGLRRSREMRVLVSLALHYPYGLEA